MYYLSIYIFIINLISIILMAMDKNFAKNNKLRISEKTLFLISHLFGSLGILLGMYMFHHKTKKRRFVYGIPIILLIQLIFLYCLF
ncbi:MAG: DUF1294 domain-containing protein [Tissierellia bacterium]|nr:DUF1294 domain-containing protein [Tissierellia bacterium]